MIILGIVNFTWPALIPLLSRQDQVDPTLLTDNFDPSARSAVFNNRTIFFPYQTLPQVLGEADAAVGSKRIEVDLTTQRLYGFENGQKIFDFLISSGTYNRTPTGTFTIWTKVRSQKMSGGSKELGTYYYLPNVPYILFFFNQEVAKRVGYSLHGTYWHNNFGRPMSHGCINMKTSDVAQIYAWAPVGTTVTIYGKYDSRLSQK